ncbi:MAG: hypothetical protein ABI663_10580 [Chryseolinea sp.]
MRQLILILLIGTIGRCNAGAFDIDTIDNWQIYNGAELILAGHDSPLGTVFHGTIKKTELRGLVIQFNHDVNYIDDLEVTVDIMDEQGKNILTKKFRTNSGTRLTIEKKELGLLATTLITIRYQEKRKNGTDKILGEIRFI